MSMADAAKTATVVEALARWDSPDSARHRSAYFIPPAEGRHDQRVDRSSTQVPCYFFFFLPVETTPAVPSLTYARSRRWRCRSAERAMKFRLYDGPLSHDRAPR